MDFRDILEYFNDAVIENEKIIIKNNLHNTIEFVVERFGYDLLKNITAVDLNDGTFELIYTLADEQNENLIISIVVKEKAESITDIFKSAISDENEIYDMFGIKFIGNENLKRLYMPEDWEGFPLRKDYIESDERLAWNNDGNNV